MSRHNQIGPSPSPDGSELRLSTEGLDEAALARLSVPMMEGKVILPRYLLVQIATQLYETRRARAQFFANSLLGEPVWDMLLALFSMTAKGERLSVSSLCKAANVPPTTGLRWVQLMEMKHLVERSRDPCDARRFHVVLTQKGETLMSAYLSSIVAKNDEG